MSSTRPAAVAGVFYPDQVSDLRATLARCADAARPPAIDMPAAPKLLVVPHAGYVYSGPVAASAYALLGSVRGITRVVLLGPVHRVPVRGLAAPTDDLFETPLGRVRVDQAALAELDELPQIERSDVVHAFEHSLEVQLPFLQQMLGDSFSLVPLAVGDATPGEVAQVLERLWGGPETLIVISSDLSHYLPYEQAQRRDRSTIDRVLAFDATLAPSDACGARALNGALRVAERHGLQPHLLDLRNSGDTAGDRKRVVGYAALVFIPSTEAEDRYEDDEAALGRATLAVARNALAEALNQPAVPEPAHPALDAPGASFVTLRAHHGELRGCIGRLEPERPLREDLRANACAAAFNDNRFPSVQRSEWPDLRIEVSLLGPLSPIAAHAEADALAQMHPGEDGIVLSWHEHQATLLPQVWQTLPAPAEFLNALKRKAGLRNDFWADDVRLQRFAVRHFDDDADDRA